MKKIQLSQGKYALIDDKDFELVSQYKWHYNNGYAKTWHKGKRIRMHRLIMNAPDGVEVDHRDLNKLNNQKANLRFCTTTQNNQNGKIRKNNTSGYKGVMLEKSTGHWRPGIYANGKCYYCGQFIDKHHAALAYDLWATDLHGEFANTNFPVVAFGP
jgi:HNH endonuclease